MRRQVAARRDNLGMAGSKAGTMIMAQSFCGCHVTLWFVGVDFAGRDTGGGSKRFFFEKKNQKTFASCRAC
jgi:hypothetical protein